MSEHAYYKKIDFVDYFKALNQVKDEWIERFINRPKCLAVLEAFTSRPVLFGRALFAVADELNDLHPTFQMLTFLQAARRHTLPDTDRRYIGYGESLQKQYPEFFPARSVKGTTEDFWFVEKRPSDSSEQRYRKRLV